MYRTLTPAERAGLRGRGFTLYGLLSEEPALAEARARWVDDVGLYDLIIVASVWRQWRTLTHPALRAAWPKVVLVDGEDGPAFFPYTPRLWRTPRAYFLGVRTRPYFKREWCGQGADYGALARWLPWPLRRVVPSPRQARTVGFAVPAEKVADFNQLNKSKDFPRHLVDPDLAALAGESFYSPVGTDRYTFATEEEYYADLRASRFGVTTRRAGWDCLRHYELAANGCVLCFRELDRKPTTCSPHGLNARNVIIYHGPDDLLGRIKTLSGGQYQDLQAATREWIAEHTTTASARRFLTAVA
jgi:hypothetical protein